MVRTVILLLVPVLLLAGPPEDIRKILDDQTAAWNKGDIDGFMKGYENSESTTYAGATGITKGYAKVLARYHQRYPTLEKMGRLVFSELDIRMLNGETYTVTGKFYLTRTKEAGGDATGWFTLIVVKRKDGWKIVHDHTS